MEEDKEKHFESDREKYGNYFKKKSTQVFDGGQFPRYQDCGDRSDPNITTPPSSSLTPFSMTSTDEPNEFSQQDENDVLMAEGVVAQHKRLFGNNQSKIQLKKYNEFLINKNKELEDRLSNRDMMVNALQRELDLVRDVSLVDASAGPLTSTSFSPDSGDSFQQRGPPLTKNEEQLLIKLKQKDAEISLLKEEIKLRDKEPVNEQLSNKMYVLECEVKEQAETIDQLNLEVVQKNKLMDRLHDQLQKKSEEFGRQNMKTSLEIKCLMRNVDELGRELRNKDNELKQAKEELSTLRREMEHNFCSQLADVKQQLKLCHDEEKGHLNLIYDDLKVRYSKVHETEVACYKKQIEALSNRVKENGQSENELETELEACRLACQVQISSYKECVENLMEELAAEKERNETEFKRQVEKYGTELERCRFELENYRQQMKNFDNRVAEEKKIVEDRYTEQIQNIHSKYEAQLVVYKCCADSLRKKEQSAAEQMMLLESKYKESINELKIEVEESKKEINDANFKLKESQNNEKNLAEELEECKSELDKFVEKSHTLSEKLQAKESNEVRIINELKRYRDLVDDYDSKMKEFENFREQMTSVEENHESEICTFQNQIDHLMSTLTDINSKHKEEVNQLVEQLMVQHQQIETLQDLAECDNIDTVYEKLKELKVYETEILSMNEKLGMTSDLINEYENRLRELQKCHESEIAIYKNQIKKLKEELRNASCLEENLVRQLNNNMTGVKESKEQLRGLLLRKDIQVYSCENQVSQTNLTDSTSSTKECNTRYQFDSELSDLPGEVSDEMKLLHNRLDHLNNENQALKEELDDLKKPKCNVSIQMHGSNEKQKRHIEEALFKELEKELHDCKIDNSSKTHDIEELIKANNDLADHYNKLETQMSDLQEFAAQKVVEINLLQDENEQLIQEKAQLQSNHIVLLRKLESFGENSNENVNVDSLPEEQINLDEECHPNLNNMKNLFKNVATSTPNLNEEEMGKEGEKDLLTPRRNVSDLKNRNNQLLSRWMNNCNELEVENAELKKELELLKLQLKEMECCTEAVKCQMGSFEENCESLKARIIELESKKKVLRELELMNEQLKLRNEKLEEDRHILRSDVANLKEENLNIEKKYDETFAKFLSQTACGDKAVEELVFELNKKSEQVLILKEELTLKQENIASLEDELDKLLEIRKEMTLRMDTLVQDLKVSEEEVLNLRQERLNIDLEKRLNDKRLTVLKAQNEQLLKHFSDKAQKNCNNGIISIVEELEKELIELHKNLSAERGVIERMAVEKTCSKNSGNSSEGSETSYKIELLLNAFEQLQNEKEGLKRKTLELQEIINKYVDGNNVDENWKLEVKESQKKLLLELETYGKQHADLGKSLIETEDLKGKVDVVEKELLQKIEEKTKVEDMLAAERQGLKNALNKIHYLEKQLCEKMNVLQILGEEKEDLQGNLLALQEKLCSLEEHLQQQKLILEGEIQERDLRVRHAHLELHAAQLDKNMMINKMIMDAEAETEMERVSHLREELEKEHDMAISRLKRLYTSQLHEVMEGAAAHQQVIEQKHHEQVVALQEKLKLMTSQVKEVINNTLSDVFNLHGIQMNEIVKNKEIQFDELKTIEKNLTGKEQEVFESVKNKFEHFMRLNVAHVVEGLKKQHDLEMETAIKNLKEENEINLMVMESTFNSYRLTEESTVYKKLEETYTNEINCLRWIVYCSTESKKFSKKSRSKITLERLIRSILSEYSSALKGLMNIWKNKYETSLSLVDQELKNSTVIETDKIVSLQSSVLESSKCDISKTDDVKNLLDLKESLINHAAELQNSLRESYKTAIEEIKVTLREAHDSVIETVEELKLQVNEGKLIASLTDKVLTLEAEKDQLEEDHKLAITLLLKDHEVELSEVRLLLDKFQPQCIEHCTDVEALLKQKTELEAKHSEQLEELRTYYEKKFAEVEKNYSEEMYSHHSRKISGSSSSSENELRSDVFQSMDAAECVPSLPNGIISAKEENTQFSKDTVEQSDEEVQTDFYEILSDNNIDFNCEPSYFHSNSQLDLQEIKLLKQINNEYENEIKNLKQELHAMKKFKDGMVNTIKETKLNKDAKCNDKIKHDLESGSETLFNDKLTTFTEELNFKEELNLNDMKLMTVVEKYEDKLTCLKEQYESEIEALNIKLKIYESKVYPEVHNSEGASYSMQNDNTRINDQMLKKELINTNVCDKNTNQIHTQNSGNEEKKIVSKEIGKLKQSARDVYYLNKIKELQKLLEAGSSFHNIEESVKQIVDDVRLSYQAEYERNKFEFSQRSKEKNKSDVNHLKEDLICQCKNLLTEEHNRHEEEKKQLKHNYDIMIENLKSQMKRQEMDHVWNVTVELEERYRSQLNELNQSWEDKLAEHLANAATDYAIQKVLLESKLTEMMKKELQIENKRTLEIIREKERTIAEAKLDEKRTKMTEELSNLKKDLEKVMEEKQNQEEVLKEFIERHNGILQKIRSQHEQQIQNIKKTHAQELEIAYYEVKKTNLKDSSIQCDQEMLVDQARIEVLSALEEQIKILVAEGDDPVIKSSWPPELATLERQFTAKYQHQLAALVKENAIEMTELKTQYESKLQLLDENCTCGASQRIADVMNGVTSEDGVLKKIIKERDSLRKLSVALRGVVCELAKYLTTCEDELNNTLIRELVKYENNIDCSQLTIVDVSEQNSDLESEGAESERENSMLQTPKRVHFAPDVTTILNEDSLLDCLDRNHDLSVEIKSELKSCLERLKLEAAAVLGLSTLKNKDSGSTVEKRRLASVTRQLIDKNKINDELNKKIEDMREINLKLNQDLADIQAELTLEKTRQEREMAETAARTETVFDEKDTAIGMEARLFNLSLLQEKARSLGDRTKEHELPAQLAAMVEEMCRQGDQLIEEARREREDLQMQVEAADKQLKSTREFLEEQAAERESERDEFSRELSRLREQLRDKDRDWTTRERFAAEWSEVENGFHELSKKRDTNVEALEQQVMETTNLLKETQKKKDEVESELKDAIDKVWVLREVIRDLENQVSFKSERQATLEQQLDELESELEAQNKAQNDLASELEAMREEANSDVHINHLRQLEEQFKKQCSSSVLRQIKSQLREMAKSLQRRTKDLESLNVHISSASLSSPSEDISIREQLDMFRCGSSTPEGCQSPVALPVEETSHLQEQLQRHARAEELAIKRIRDQDMQLAHLRVQYEDVQAERDVLQEKCEKQLSQLAATQTRLDDVRRRVEWEQAKSDAVLIEKISQLEEELLSVQKNFKLKEKEVLLTQQRLAYMERQMANKDVELCAHVDLQNKQVDLLQHELSVMEIEKRKLELMLRKCKEGQNISIPALMEEILAEKNADIDLLEQKVKDLQASQNDNSFFENKSLVHTSHSNSKGHHVSFADDVTNPGLHDSERTREAEFDSSISANFQPFLNNNIILNESSPSSLGKNMQPPDVTFGDLASELAGAAGDCSPKWIVSPKEDSVKLDLTIEELKQELESKTNDLKQYEERLKEIPTLENELKKTRDDLQATLASVAEDKNYCQKQLALISDFQTKLNDKECEVQRLKDELSQKEENLIRVTADVKALQLVLDKLQEKINDARVCAKLNNSAMNNTVEFQNVKEENTRLNQEISVMKKELSKVSSTETTLLKQNLKEEKLITENLKTDLKKAKEEKEIILSQLEIARHDCDNYQSKLDDVLNQLMNSESELNKLQTELKTTKETNDNLNQLLVNVKTELKQETLKARLDMENHIKKNSEDVRKLKEELQQLKDINSDLEGDCNQLRTELNVAKENLNLHLKVSGSEGRIEELEKKILDLEIKNKNLLDDKLKAEHKAEIDKEHYDSLNATVQAYKNSENIAQEAAVKEKIVRVSSEKKLQFIKREYDKMKRAKKELEKKNTVLKEELEKEKKHTSALEVNTLRRRSTELLSSTPIDTFEIKPVSERIAGSFDELAEQVQKELDTSAQLDKSLLSTLDSKQTSSGLPSEHVLSVLQKIIQNGFQSITAEEAMSLYIQISSKIEVKSPGLSNMMERLSELSSVIQNQKGAIESLKDQLGNERLRYSKEKEHVITLQSEGERLQKIISYQEERLTSLSVTVEESRKRSSDLEVCVLKERGNFKKLQVLLENEREKVKQIQLEDTELIQDLRMCLEEAKDSEVRLQLCLEQERDRLQTLEAQLNAARVVEQYFSQPSSDTNPMSKCLDDLKSKCTELGVELEREKRNVGSLSVSLSKEKAISGQLRTKLHSTHAENIQLQAQIEDLKLQVFEEQKKKCETEEKVKTIQEAEIRRQRSRAAAEERHRKALDRAKLQKNEMESEITRLRKHLSEAQNEDVAASGDGIVSSLPLLLQIKDVNFELEKLVKEKEELKNTVSTLLGKNKELQDHLNQISDSNKNQNKDAKYYMGLYIRSKSHRKSLIWQKKYLMLALQGYQESEQKLMLRVSERMRSTSWVPENFMKRKYSFKLAALTVIAIIRMKSIVRIRRSLLGANYKAQSPKREFLLQQQRVRSFSPRNISGLSSLSPPIRDVKSNFSSRNEPSKSSSPSPLLQPTRLADYLETFNELQSRLSHALGSPQKDLSLDRTVISRVIN